MNSYLFYGLTAFFSLWVYFGFRSAVTSYLRVHKRSRTFIRKHKKGYVNYWLYKKLHEVFGLGLIYPYHILLMTVTAAYIVLSLALGWIASLRLPFALMHLVLCFIEIPGIVFEEIYENLENGNTKFVLFTYTEYRGVDSSLFRILGIALLLLWAVFDLKEAL